MHSEAYKFQGTFVSCLEYGRHELSKAHHHELTKGAHIATKRGITQQENPKGDKLLLYTSCCAMEAKVLLASAMQKHTSQSAR